MTGKPADSSPKRSLKRTEPAQTGPGNRDQDSLFAAILLAFFFHLLLFWATPSAFFEKSRGEQPVSPSMEIILEPIPEEPELEETYVRAAPNIAEAQPDETRNISDRNQQAAQEEEALPDPDNTPMVEGDEERSNRLVQGNPFQEPTPPAPPSASPSSGGSPMVQQEAAPEEVPSQTDPDYLEQPPETDEGIASVEDPDVSRQEPEDPTRMREPVAVTSPLDGAGDARMTTPAQAPEEAAPVPRPRQRVERDTSFGPIKDNQQGAIRVGRLAFDAQYSEFGEYWRRVAEIIEARWRSLVYNTKSIPFGGYRVVVQFNISREGQVEDVVIGYSNAGRLTETISKDAIISAAPFAEWTPEMIVRMGEKAGCAIHFYY